MSIVFVFLDGIGLAPRGDDNPLSDAATPTLQALLGGPLVSDSVQAGLKVLLAGIDATLGVPGLPQSGTGQTALLTGMNAAALHGRHQPYFPPVALRPLLAEQNIFRRVVQRGGRATFANVFTTGYWQALEARQIRRSASVIATEGAGLRFRTLDDLRAGRALPPDITGAGLRLRGEDVQVITPAAAGAVLAHLAHDYDLVFYENVLPDMAAHGRLAIDVPTAFALIDAMLAGLLATLRPQDSLLITSDHGNAESRAAPAHTRNPVPLLVVGPAAPAFTHVTDIAGVAGAILQQFGG